MEIWYTLKVAFCNSGKMIDFSIISFRKNEYLKKLILDGFLLKIPMGVFYEREKLIVIFREDRGEP